MKRRRFLVVLVLVLRKCLVAAADVCLTFASLAVGCGTAGSDGILLNSLKKEEGKSSMKDMDSIILVESMLGREWKYSSVFIIMVALLCFSRLSRVIDARV